MESPRVLIDGFGRRLDYLRISITDRCNFSCVYCTPFDPSDPVPYDRYLSPAQIERFVRAASNLGVRRVRLTGGEPLLRADAEEVVRRVRLVPGIEDVSMTTNGSLLEERLESLKAAGLGRLNISLDSLEPKRFLELTRSREFDRVFRSVFAALRAGFPVKVNIVAVRGLRRREIGNFTDLAVRWPIEIRFLEYMPLCGSSWDPDFFMPIREVRECVASFCDMEELPRDRQVAQSFAVKGGRGRIGFIGSMTESFCRECSRLRLGSDGKIYPCLFSSEAIDAGPALRARGAAQDIETAIRLAVAMKPSGNGYEAAPFRPGHDFTMPEALIRAIGG